jgi:hypothetical protein
MFRQISLRNEGFVPLLAMIGGLDCGDLGYDLGYLRHGSIGPGLARWSGRLRRVAACALARLGRFL